MTAVTTTHPESETAKPIHRTAAALFAALAVAAAFAIPATANAARFGDSSSLPVACDLADCDFTVDPSAEDQCFIPGGDSNQPRASFVVSGDRVLAFNVPWGQDPGFDAAAFDNTRRVVVAGVSGNWEDIFSRCDRKLVASTGRALGVYAWLTRDELDQVAPFIAYPGLPADLVPAGDSLAGDGETVEPVGDATDNRPDAQQVTKRKASEAGKRATANRSKKASATKKATSKSKRPAAKKRGR